MTPCGYSYFLENAPLWILLLSENASLWIFLLSENAAMWIFFHEASVEVVDFTLKVNKVNSVKKNKIGFSQ
jgi:hypothetical protein